jgi:hypothetical protein
MHARCWLHRGAETLQGEPLTAQQALAAFYAAQGLPPDGGSRARAWRIELGPLSIPMPNFRWRSQALPVHDLHHVLTGYPCTPAGEFEMAAWEFAAGRYPHAGATAFCLPLVGLGALACPRRTYAAFVRGRASRTLYGRGMSAELLQTPVSALQNATVDIAARPAASRDALHFVALAAIALGWTALPLLLLALLVLS